MPNRTGGKAYKKTKHSGGDDDGSLYIDKQEGQMYGRIVRIMGALNVLIYCNDGYERICHIRGSMRKRTWLHIGDIVLLSLRDFTGAATGKERGDIIAKYEPKFYSRLKKDPEVNPTLFMTVGTSDTLKSGHLPDSEEGGYEIDNDSDSSESDTTTAAARAEGQYYINNRRPHQNTDDNIDIDAI